MFGTVGEAANKPPSMLYCTEKPLIAGTLGRAKADAQVLAGADITGAFGKTTTDTRALDPQAPVPAVPKGVLPQEAAVT